MRFCLKVKRGDTFAMVLEYAPDGVPTSLAGATVESQVRDDQGFVDNLTVVVEDQIATPGRVTISRAYASTAAWPVGELLGDIQITKAGVRTSSEDFLVQVAEDRTQ